MSPVKPTTVSQINNYETRTAERAIDGNLNTHSHTDCAWDTDLWYKMKFDAVYCFSDVVIINSHTNDYSARMDDTEVFVVNTKTGTESLCGVLKVSDVLTIDGQTYRIPCDLKCGDEVKLTLRHESQPVCIHTWEIMAFLTGSY